MVEQYFDENYFSSSYFDDNYFEGFAVTPAPVVPSIAVYDIFFAGVTLAVVQAGDSGYTISSKETTLLSGLTHAAVSPVVKKFPKLFSCFTDSETLFDTLESFIGVFGNLVVDEKTYQNCWISDLKDIKEIILDTGMFTYTIEFRQAGVH